MAKSMDEHGRTASRKNSLSLKGCRHESSPLNILSVKELPGKTFFASFYLAPIPGAPLMEERNLYKNYRPMPPENPPQHSLT
ncbi:MAG: hypothetical protein ACE5DW_02650 [Thermodesulfobacteriota bacterium]